MQVRFLVESRPMRTHCKKISPDETETETFRNVMKCRGLIHRHMFPVCPRNQLEAVPAAFNAKTAVADARRLLRLTG